MKQTIDVYGFRRAFERTDRKDQFSYEGLEALFNWLEQYEDNTGEETELDIIALCCDFTEYESIEEVHGEYDADDYPDWDKIAEYTSVINLGCDGGFIIQQF